MGSEGRVRSPENVTRKWHSANSTLGIRRIAQCFGEKIGWVVERQCVAMKSCELLRKTANRNWRRERDSNCGPNGPLNWQARSLRRRRATRGVGGERGSLPIRPQKSRQFLAFSSNSHGLCHLALADPCTRFRLFASVFGSCQCNDTRNITRREPLRGCLPRSSRRESAGLAPECHSRRVLGSRSTLIADLRFKLEGASGTLSPERWSDEESIDESRHP